MKKRAKKKIQNSSAKKKVNWKILIVCLVVVFIFAGIGSFFSSDQTKSAYYVSIKPDLTPPNWVFPLVWNFLFVLLAYALYFSWIKSEHNPKNRNKIVLIFLLNLAFNVLWSFLFFVVKNPLFAFFDIILLLISIVWIFAFNWKFERKSSYLVVPYFVWVLFAAYLNWVSYLKWVSLV